ncbi:hypothetical protein ACKVMT_04195 [Halobacteriales archaeon Cl-PHB]
MSDSGRDPSISRDLSRLVGTLEDLRRELEPGDRRRLRPPSANELRRFTTDVTIPALILVLETNVRALKIVQRALRHAEGDAEADRSAGTAAVGRRANDVTREALGRLDAVLADVGDALEGTPPDDEARDLLQEARDLQSAVEDGLAERDDTPRGGDDGSASVPVDVDAELDAIRDQLDDDGGDPERPGT